MEKLWWKSNWKSVVATSIRLRFASLWAQVCGSSLVCRQQYPRRKWRQRVAAIYREPRIPISETFQLGADGVTVNFLFIKLDVSGIPFFLSFPPLANPRFPFSQIQRNRPPELSRKLSRVYLCGNNKICIACTFLKIYPLHLSVKNCSTFFNSISFDHSLVLMIHFFPFNPSKSIGREKEWVRERARERFLSTKEWNAGMFEARRWVTRNEIRLKGGAKRERGVFPRRISTSSVAPYIHLAEKPRRRLDSRISFPRRRSRPDGNGADKFPDSDEDRSPFLMNSYGRCTEISFKV